MYLPLSFASSLSEILPVALLSGELALEAMTMLVRDEEGRRAVWEVLEVVPKLDGLTRNGETEKSKTSIFNIRIGS